LNRESRKLGLQNKSQHFIKTKTFLVTKPSINGSLRELLLMEIRLFLEEKARVDAMKQEGNIIKVNQPGKEIKESINERIMVIGKSIQWYLD